MQVQEIPFVKLLDIQQDNTTLFLEYKKNVLNHVQTIHASAQFTLAETQSGLYLQELFPHLEGKVVPLLRDSTIKYKRPAQKKIYALASISDENLQKFQEQFEKKGRGSVEVNVVVKDVEETVTAVATFVWFVASL